MRRDNGKGQGMAKKEGLITYVVTPKVQQESVPVPLRLIRAETPKQLREYLIDGFNIAPASVEDGMKAQEQGVRIESAIPASTSAA